LYEKVYSLQLRAAFTLNFSDTAMPLLRMLIDFAARNLCESRFSALVHIKLKCRSKTESATMNFHACLEVATADSSLAMSEIALK